LKKIILIAALVVSIEIVSAPIEWFWPVPWGGTTHWAGVGPWNGIKRATGSEAKKQLALTFDDGPSAYTEQVLDILKAYDAKATFFVMGNQVERYPHLVARMTAEGHEIGNHTYDFEAQKFVFFSDIDLNSIKHNSDVIENLSGQRPKYYRSPGGQMGRKLWQAVRAENLYVVYGMFPMPDVKGNAQKQLESTRQTIKPGAIMVLHDGDDHKPDSDRPKATVEMLPLLLAEMKAQGFTSVTVSTLLQQP
jgi:peptidoglycan-N-acetylglucosamine deacetylase